MKPKTILMMAAAAVVLVVVIWAGVQLAGPGSPLSAANAPGPLPASPPKSVTDALKTVRTPGLSEFRAISDPALKAAFVSEQAPALEAPAAEALLRAAVKDPDPRVRQEALGVLDACVPLAVEKELLGILLQDGDELIRDRSLHRVHELNAQDQVDVLARAIADAREDTALKVIPQLGSMGTKPAVEALVAVMEHPLSAARLAAARTALERISGKTFASGGAARQWWAGSRDGLNHDLSVRLEQ